MKALIVGGDGIIGSALTKALVSRGDTVCKTTRRSALAERNATQLDLASFDVDALRLPEADVAFFCAAITGFAACRTNEAIGASGQRNVPSLAGPSIGGGRNKGGSIVNQRSLRLAFPSRAGKLPAMSGHSIREAESGGGDGIFRVWRCCLYPPADKSTDAHR